MKMKPQMNQHKKQNHKKTKSNICYYSFIKKNKTKTVAYIYKDKITTKENIYV